jgi:60 kDa SS-A/Ro ribonucleoprotein
VTQYAKHVSTRKTPQSEAIPGKAMVENNAGGFGFKIDNWERLNRFLILGSCGGTYYVGEKKLTQENTAAILNCIREDGRRVVDTVVEISDSGRALKNDPAIFVLALCASAEESETRQYALYALPKVCRIGTHLFQFAESVQEFRGWGRSLRRAIANWYTSKDVEDLAYQMAKYQQRNGWSHHDLMHLAHPKPVSDEQKLLFSWAKRSREGEIETAETLAGLPPIIEVMEEIKSEHDLDIVVKAIHDFGLTREMLPTEVLSRHEVWEALLEKMPMTAMIRNLGNMSKVGLLKPMSSASKVICQRLIDETYLKKARVHPLSILVAMKIRSRQGNEGFW